MRVIALLAVLTLALAQNYTLLSSSYPVRFPTKYVAQSNAVWYISESSEGQFIVRTDGSQVTASGPLTVTDARGSILTAVGKSVAVFDSVDTYNDKTLYVSDGTVSGTNIYTGLIDANETSPNDGKNIYSVAYTSGYYLVVLKKADPPVSYELFTMPAGQIARRLDWATSTDVPLIVSNSTHFYVLLSNSNIYVYDPVSGTQTQFYSFGTGATGAPNAAFTVVGSYVYVVPKVTSATTTSTLYRFPLTGTSQPTLVVTFESVETTKISAAPTSTKPDRALILRASTVLFCDSGCTPSATITLSNVASGVYGNGVYYYIDSTSQSLYRYDGSSSSMIRNLGNPSLVRNINLNYHAQLNFLFFTQRSYTMVLKQEKYTKNELWAYDIANDKLIDAFTMCTDSNTNCGPLITEASNFFILSSGLIIAEKNQTRSTIVYLNALPYQQFAPATTVAPTTTTTTAAPTPTPTPIYPYVYEIYTSYEKCEDDNTLAPIEERASWNNKTLPLGQLQPGETIYGSFQAYDIPDAILAANQLYARINFDNLVGKVTIRWRQVHTTTAIQTKSSFFAMNRPQRQLFYQQWLPGTEPHDTDISYPAPKEQSSCNDDFNCGFVIENIKFEDQSDVLPVFVFSITNIEKQPLGGNTKVTAYVGDKTPDCRVAPVGIVLGSLWTAAIFIIIIIVVVLLAWEKIMLQKQGAYIPSASTPTL